MILAFRPFATMASFISDDELDFLKQTISRAESFGPFVDPTQYRTALQTGSLERQRQLIELFARTKADLEALFPGGRMDHA